MRLSEAAEQIQYLRVSSVLTSHSYYCDVMDSGLHAIIGSSCSEKTEATSKRNTEEFTLSSDASLPFPLILLL